jgi:DNA-binding beta-propeller fold protein YncE
MNEDDPEERLGDLAPAPPARSRRKLWISGGIFAAIVVVAVSVVGFRALLHYARTWHRNEEREQQLALAVSPAVHDPRGVAVDAAGNVYVADSSTNRVLKLAVGSNAPTALPFTGLKLSTGVVNNSLAGVAVDAPGNVYVVDSGNNRVLKLADASSKPTTLPFTGLDRPSGVAVDSAGDVYLADSGNERVLELVAGSSTQTVLPSTRGAIPDGVAVDSAGTVYTGVYKYCGLHATCHYLLKLAAGSDNWTDLPSAGVEQHVAVDTAGNLYVVTLGESGGVMKLAPGSSSWTKLPGVSGFRAPAGLAVDTHGNVYVTDNQTPGEGATGRGLIVKLPIG